VREGPCRSRAEESGASGWKPCRHRLACGRRGSERGGLGDRDGGLRAAGATLPFVGPARRSGEADWWDDLDSGPQAVRRPGSSMNSYGMENAVVVGLRVASA
jgi:hypothetical protein